MDLQIDIEGLNRFHSDMADLKKVFDAAMVGVNHDDPNSSMAGLMRFLNTPNLPNPKYPDGEIK
jgi:hypothetical protein